MSVLLGFIFLSPLYQRYGIRGFCIQDNHAVSFDSIAYGVLVLLLSVGGCTSFELFRRWVVSDKKILELEKATKQTELQQLKKQINPHFLFNMLNNANILVKDAPDEASQILEKLDNLLRYQLNDSTRREVFLTADIQFLTSFLELEKVRRDHFEYTIFQEGNMENICIPPLLFIPFVENAVKHNLDSDNLSYVHLYFSVHNKQLTFRCENSKPRVPVKREGGIGLPM
ncbi:histidine kinase [Bacteroides ovatus]|nr:histidine kinase [Bacteroides ovatus]